LDAVTVQHELGTRKAVDWRALCGKNQESIDRLMMQEMSQEDDVPVKVD